MTTVPIDNTSVDSGFNLRELTEGSLTGKGVFDVLLQTLRVHLDREFRDNRITGTAYATVYSQAITSFLGHAVQFTLSKSKLALELQQMQEQVTLLQKQQDQLTASIRQTDYVTDFQLPSQVSNQTKQTELLEYDLTQLKPVELANAQQEILLKTAQAALASYELTNIKPQELALLQQQVAAQLYTVQTRLPVEVLGIEADTALKTYDLANVKPAELQSITADTSLKAYELTDIKPTQKAQIVAETSHVTKQELNTVQQTLNLGSQQAQIETETARILYEITNKLPEEVQLIKLNQDQLIAQNNKIATDTVVTIKQGHLTDAQTCQVTAQTNQVNAEVALKLPVEVAQVEAQSALLAYDLATVKPVEVANLTKQGSLVDSQKVVADKQALNITAETTQVNYRINYVLPEEVKVLKFNQDQIVAQTTKVGMDTVTVSKQGKLIDAQVCEVKAQANQINANVALKLPEEVTLLQRNQTHLTAQTTHTTAQTANTNAQTSQVSYTTSSVLPAQVLLTNAQADSAAAQTALYAQKTTTELAQTTTTPANGSVMGVQNLLMNRQAENYIRDAEQKAAKLMLETWNVRFSTDSTSADFDTVNHLSEADVGVAVNKLITGIGGTVVP